MPDQITTCACGCYQQAPAGLIPAFASNACRLRWIDEHQIHGQPYGSTELQQWARRVLRARPAA